MNERELKINQIAQGLISLEDGLKWFDGVTADSRTDIMRSLDLCIFQSHPSIDDIEQGIKKSGLKESYSPCVLIRKKPFNQVMQKILAMPELDLRRGFILLISVFSVADSRRRMTQCKGECGHDWHNIGL
jgi:hypothetical protein